MFRVHTLALLLIILLILAVTDDAFTGLAEHSLRAVAPVYAANADHTTDRLLKAVVPGADSFSAKSGKPPVYRAYRTDLDSGEQTLVGYAFVTPDVPPEPSGYSGPIDTLIGMDLDGKIVGLRVIYYKESHRYTIGDFFSWGFEEQFIGLDAYNRFRVGKEIDGIAKATISAKAAARGIRQTLRAVTTAYITE